MLIAVFLITLYLMNRKRGLREINCVYLTNRETSQSHNYAVFKPLFHMCRLPRQLVTYVKVIIKTQTLPPHASSSTSSSLFFASCSNHRSLSAGSPQFTGVISPSMIPADIYLNVTLQREINYTAADSKILHRPRCENRGETARSSTLNPN